MKLTLTPTPPPAEVPVQIKLDDAGDGDINIVAVVAGRDIVFAYISDTGKIVTVCMDRSDRDALRTAGFQFSDTCVVVS